MREPSFFKNQQETVSDPLQKLITELEAKSPYQRETIAENREQITSPEGKKFEITCLMNPEDPLVEKIHESMIEEFGREEVETLEDVREAIERGSVWYHALTGGDGKVIGLSSSLYREPMPKDSSPPTESMLYVGHIYVNPSERGKGFAKELYRAMYKTIARESERQGKKPKAIIGETDDREDIEEFLNTMGRSRIYYEDRQGNAHEVPYKSPSVEMDPATGGPMPDAPALSQHLTLQMLDGRKEVTAEELMEMVRSVHEAYLQWDEYFDTPEAVKAAARYIDSLTFRTEQELAEAKDGKISLMNADERKERKKELAKTKKRLTEVKSD